ncbi:membrane protein DedA with SNARE-associated domain [Sphingomonas kyeonggiensis]|uniref:Membrane protein DedA with SNARE-associated domain n=1 Tax=Sphingomonas kyeonggiensis TaxID=1268553 RepID=A0A7W7NS80_9SPHN|nr:DedA family protein [Sphingomonas kyeonggiensis]MBB4838501.1 membrane protein DedA with SNARE-associated domain [Sphingomonas kyeonggiensis]
MVDWLDWGYFGVFLLMVLENVIPPVPSELIMSVAGIAAGQGKMDFALLVLTGTAGCAIGNLFWWEIGRRFGYKRLEPLVRRWGRWLTLEWEDIEKLRHFFDRWGGITVLVFRFMPIGRTVISIPAGLMHMPLGRFLVYTTIGSAIWNTILVGVGYWLGTNFETVDHWIAPVSIAAIAAVAVLYLWRVFTWKPRG